MFWEKITVLTVVILIILTVKFTEVVLIFIVTVNSVIHTIICLFDLQK